ncbi:MAG: aldolase [Nitrospirae bacterium]|nr:aldolase [Nitrospirota bacterium]
MKYAINIRELEQGCKDIIDLANKEINITDVKGLRENLIDYLIYTVVFSPDIQARKKAHRIIWYTAINLGIYPASIHSLYMAMGRDEVKGFTTPAMNFRCLTYDVCRRVFRVASSINAGAFIFEIAKSEMQYTFQSPAEYTACVLAAAIKENYRGPVFIQGDHFQLKADNYKTDPEGELSSLKDLCKKAVNAGFYNIDIDASTLVDYSKQSLSDQQYHNYLCTAALTAFLREIEPEGITISVGAEIGHIGGKNSTPHEARAFMEGFKNSFLENTDGISKLSVQTGTAHGGIPLPDGTVADVKLDFRVLKDIGELVKKEYGLSGTVQHGASTLPDELFDKFPENNCSEIHLATGFQNIMYDFAPEEFKQEIYGFLKESFRSDWKDGMTEQQFIYKSRKRGFGPFKQKWWSLPVEYKSMILDEIEKKLKLLFEKLGVKDTKPFVNKYIPEVIPPYSEPEISTQSLDATEIKLEEGAD